MAGKPRARHSAETLLMTKDEFEKTVNVGDRVHFKFHDWMDRYPTPFGVVESIAPRRSCRITCDVKIFKNDRKSQLRKSTFWLPCDVITRVEKL